MLSRRALLALAAASLSIAFVASDAVTAFAKRDHDDVRLFARMTNGVAKAQVRYEEVNNNTRRKFRFEIERATPGQVLTVNAGGQTVGTVTVDSSGRARFDLDTQKRHAIPDLNAGDVVEVVSGGTVILSGPLK